MGGRDDRAYADIRPMALRRLRSCAKTSKPVRFENTETTRQSLERWISDPGMLGLEFLWPSRVHHGEHLSTRQHARILREWVMSIGLKPNAYGTHWIRRSKARTCP
ncbi:hypothetical protein [Paracoccus sp. PAR01]|uniref:hypothetical protein n=1 Tax=Paracoccus sp. PAR01 TaxID=2769282 RepID=UPI00178636A1|nr:hypothetical protein [Paracoccus sp. PAR01]MBD9529392.1 hypothetical protein [Paracoccus sp. PAR01]